MKNAHFYFIQGDVDATRDFLDRRQATELNGGNDATDDTIVYAQWSNEYWTMPSMAIPNAVGMILICPTPVYCITTSKKFIEQYPINNIDVTYQTI